MEFCLFLQCTFLHVHHNYCAIVEAVFVGETHMLLQNQKWWSNPQNFYQPYSGQLDFGQPLSTKFKFFLNFFCLKLQRGPRVFRHYQARQIPIRYEGEPTQCLKVGIY